MKKAAKKTKGEQKATARVAAREREREGAGQTRRDRERWKRGGTYALAAHFGRAVNWAALIAKAARCAYAAYDKRETDQKTERDRKERERERETSERPACLFSAMTTVICFSHIFMSS